MRAKPYSVLFTHMGSDGEPYTGYEFTHATCPERAVANAKAQIKKDNEMTERDWKDACPEVELVIPRTRLRAEPRIEGAIPMRNLWRIRVTRAKTWEETFVVQADNLAEAECKAEDLMRNRLYAGHFTDGNCDDEIYTHGDGEQVI